VIKAVIVLYEACPESKDKKVLNMYEYNIFNLQKATL